MIECRGGGVYTGIAVDVEARYQMHASGKGAKYTKMNPPVRLIAAREYPDRRSAAQAEYAMKQLTPLEKRQWVFALNNGLTV
jgi:putative endonuclease